MPLLREGKLNLHQEEPDSLAEWCDQTNGEASETKPVNCSHICTQSQLTVLEHATCGSIGWWGAGSGWCGIHPSFVPGSWFEIHKDRVDSTSTKARAEARERHPAKDKI
eukprot:scaffold868_cov249-Pinguiococcus_pyrenoidosus.AAC.3